MIEYIFFYKDIIIGGCELLIEKVSSQIIKEGFHVKILCRTIDESMLKRFEQSGVMICQLHDWESNKELGKLISTDQEVRVITFFWEDFVRLYSLKRRSMKTILYAVHFQELTIGANCRFSLIKEILKAAGARSVFKLLQSKRILCMDEQIVRYTQNYFQKKFLNDASMYQIVRVPINIVAVSESQMEKRARDPEFNILAIARAEFPFKGYLLGLIDFIEKLEYKNRVHLDIVSYGSDIDKLKSKLNALDAETKKLITLHGKTDYDALEQYYDHAKLYIGMGTTILDAAQRGIISIPIAPYTKEIVANKFFHEDYRILWVNEKEANNILNLWETVRELSSEEYLELSEKTRKNSIENYSVQKTTEKILNNFDEIKYDKFSWKVFIFQIMRETQLLIKRKDKRFEG